MTDSYAQRLADAISTQEPKITIVDVDANTPVGPIIHATDGTWSFVIGCADGPFGGAVYSCSIDEVMEGCEDFDNHFCGNFGTNLTEDDEPALVAAALVADYRDQAGSDS